MGKALNYSWIPSVAGFTKTLWDGFHIPYASEVIPLIKTKTQRARTFAIQKTEDELVKKIMKENNIKIEQNFGQIYGEVRKIMKRKEEEIDILTKEISSELLDISKEDLFKKYKVNKSV